MKIWIAGSVAQFGEEDNIRELVKTFEYFDGAFFNVNYNRNETEFLNTNPLKNYTFDLLNRNKRKGRVIWTPWLKRHDYAMNSFLHMVPNGSWFLSIDAQELPKEEFLKGIRERVEVYENNGITSMWWNRPFLIKKAVGMEYRGNPHCWPSPLVNNRYVNIADETQVKYEPDGTVHFGDFIYNKKKRENTTLLSGVKYSLYDPPNNQFEMFYKGQDFVKHEQKRMWFCNRLDDFGYQRDLAGLKAFFRDKNNLTKEIIDYLNWEHVFNSFYRYKILNHSLENIMKDRYDYKINNE